ncbi:CHASE domain-containing protein [Alkalihalobacterium alkalinitrilicum]|uniref:CHASE domain-containing protein n=1 Tax=Alkalihalobacterium alkalinitrilicum TaxID=427920 RepID=UPI000994E886
MLSEFRPLAVQEDVTTTIDEYDVWPEIETDDFAINIYVHPEQHKIPGVGYNHFSEPVRFASIIQARDTGEITVTDKLTLITIKVNIRQGL